MIFEESYSLLIFIALSVIVICIFYNTKIRSIVDSEKKYRMLFDNSPNMIVLLDQNFMLKDFNRKFGWISGINQNNQVKKSIFDFWKNEKKENIANIKNKVIEGKIFIKELNFSSYTGDNKIILAMLSPLDKKNIIFIGVDITEERRMEKELYEEKERMSVVLNAVGEGIINTDSEGNILIVNKTALNIVETNEEKLIGKNINSFLEIYLKKDKLNIISELKHNKKIINLRKQAFVGKNKIPVAITCAPLFDNFHEFKGTVISFRDIRNEKKIEEEMINIQKLESIELFAAGIAHDFNNILTSVLGNISVASQIVPDKTKAFICLKSAEKGCKNARELTRELLTFAKGEVDESAVIDVGRMIKDCINISIDKEKIKIKVDIDKNISGVEGIITKLKQVFNNVIINAIQADNGDKKIFIKAENIEADKIDNPYFDKKDYVKVTVKDKGRGIEKEIQKKIFEPYFTTKKNGTGLGLATVNAIVKNHGGFIKVDSEPGLGTSFSVFLPAAVNSKYFSSEQRNKVLVMDDDYDIREVLSMMLNEMDYEVEFASKGEEVIEKIKDKKTYSFIMLDLTIKNGMGGLETIKTIRELGLKSSVIVSSGYSRKNITQNFRDYGFDDILTKPFTVEELVNVIKRLKS
ncbi:MAG: hybrid sensor histidine kinase/response regulator [Candidatus Muiribacteriota bacterium]